MNIIQVIGPTSKINYSEHFSKTFRKDSEKTVTVEDVLLNVKCFKKYGGYYAVDTCTYSIRKYKIRGREDNSTHTKHRFSKILKVILEDFGCQEL